MMESPFKNDPFAMVYQAFRRLYPDKQCEIWWQPRQVETDEGAYGFTDFPDNGGIPQVIIFTDYPVGQQLEILAHELAHVAVGVNFGHGVIWNKAFESIQTEYEKICVELFGGDV